MRTESPLAGLKISEGHPAIHLGMFIAQRISMNYFDSSLCGRWQEDALLVVMNWMHLFCFTMQMIVRLVHWPHGLIGFSNFLQSVTIFAYLGPVFAAQHFELSTIYSEPLRCSGDDLKISPRIWLLIELRVYYGFIFSSIILLTFANFFRVNWQLRQHTVSIKNGKKGHGDFLVKYYPLQAEFCRYQLVLIVSAAVFIEHMCWR